MRIVPVRASHCKCFGCYNAPMRELAVSSRTLGEFALTLGTFIVVGEVSNKLGLDSSGLSWTVAISAVYLLGRAMDHVSTSPKLVAPSLGSEVLVWAGEALLLIFGLLDKPRLGMPIAAASLVSGLINMSGRYRSYTW